MKKKDRPLLRRCAVRARHCWYAILNATIGGYLRGQVHEETLHCLERCDVESIVEDALQDVPSEKDLAASVEEVVEQVERTERELRREIEDRDPEIDYEDLAAHIDYEDLADHVSPSSIAEEIDLSDLAEQFSANDIAEEISLFALALEIEASDLAKEVDLNELAGELDAGQIADNLGIGLQEIMEYYQADSEDDDDVFARRIAAALVKHGLQIRVGPNPITE